MATVSPIQLGTLLVPTDFSTASEAALAQAIHLAGAKKPVVILLHVIDPALATFATDHGFASESEVIEEMRSRAQRELAALKARFEDRAVIDTVISQGAPFLEILKKSEDFAVDAIVIGKIGTRGALEKLLFGSTAEKVLRGSRRLVIVVPTA
jgi:glycine betaine transporter